MKTSNFPTIIVTILLTAATAWAGPGDLDTSFSSDGKLTTPIGSYDDIAYDVAFQADGKLVVVGSSEDGSGTPNIAVVRYHESGSLDYSFGTSGKICPSRRVASSACRCTHCIHLVESAHWGLRFPVCLYAVRHCFPSAEFSRKSKEKRDEGKSPYSV